MNLSDYENLGYRGIDASLEISLFEYGFIFKKEQERQDTFTFIYGKNINENCEFITFDWRTMSKKEFIELTQEKWFNLDGVLSFIGQTKEDFLAYFP